MEWSYSNSLALSTLLFLISLILKLKHTHSRLAGSKQLPPGPPAWPIFGNIFNLGTHPHQSLYKLRFKYGPVIWLKLGFANTLVIQSAKAAEQLFKNHDVQFSDRKVPEALTAHNYYQGSLVFSPHGSGWRILHRLVKLELMTCKKIGESVYVRRQCINKMIQFIEEDAAAALAKGESGEITLSRYIFVMAFNLIGNLIFSRDLVDSHSEAGAQFFNAVDMVMKWAGKPNIADFFPFLRAVDPQRIRKNMEGELGRTMNVVNKFIKERIEERKSTKERESKDFLDSVFEEYQGEGVDQMSTNSMLIIISEMFIAGTETTSMTLEWVMAELFRSPKSMERVKEELNRVIRPKKKVEESDLDQLPYLQAVIKETMRLHPILPLLVPRNTKEETKFMGYVIPKDTQVFVNAWAIGRDPDAWEDPLIFKPERFLNSDIDYRGQNFELIPFGSGRRICVGITLAHQVLHLTLASLLHCFDWEIASNSVAEATNMNENMGITIRKLVPLKAIPKKIVQ